MLSGVTACRSNLSPTSSTASAKVDRSRPFSLLSIIMSRNIRPNRAGVGAGGGALPAKASSRFEEYDDEYPSRNKYHSDDYPTQTNAPGRTTDARRGPVNNGRYDQTTSGSSAGSTLLERMKNKNQDHSGRGNVEDEYDSPREQKATWARNPGATSLRTQRADPKAPRDECTRLF